MHKDMIDLSKYTSLFDIAIHFDTPKKCKDALAQSRWAVGKRFADMFRKSVGAFRYKDVKVFKVA